MNKKFTRVASLLCSLFALATLTVNAQSKLISFWDFNQSFPLNAKGTDSLGTRYSYANSPGYALHAFSGSTDSTNNTAPVYPAYTTSGTPTKSYILVGDYPKGKSYLENSSGGATYYDYSSNHNYFNLNHPYIAANDSALAGNVNDYVKLINPVQLDTVYMYLPTTGYENINLDFALSASSTKAAQFCIFSYSTNSGNTWKNLTKAMDTFNVSNVRYPDSLMLVNPITAASNWYPVQINFSSDASVNNNGNFVLRWVYAGSNVTGTSGNNRYDNFALSGDSVCPVFTTQPVNFVSCGNGATSFTVNVAGGSNLSYQWMINTGHGFGSLNNGGVYSGATTHVLAISNVSGLNGYQYECVVSSNCSNITSNFATLTVDPAMVVSVASFTNVTCTGKGAATAGVSGGTSPYTYLWNPGGLTTATVTGLSAGTYTLTLTDADGCSGTATANILSTGVSITITSFTNYECNLGTAVALAANGTPPYIYSWSNGQTTAAVSGLSAGTYTVAAIDSKFCSGSATVTISRVALIRDSISTSAAPTVIHYWDFNNTPPSGGAGGDSLGTATFPLPAEYSLLSKQNPQIIYTHPSADGILDNVSPSPTYCFYNDLPLLGNDSGGAATGNLGVRARNPSQGAYMYLYLPTTGYSNITLNYAISASSSKGANYNILSYSTNGGNTWKNLTKAMDTFNISGVYRPDTLQVINPITAASAWYPVSINFTSDPSVNNNAGFIVRWQYQGANAILTSGNDRYDNISLTGIPTGAGTEPCFGSAQVNATVGVKNGSAPYTYVWTPNVSSGSKASSLSAGTYMVNVEDAAGCSATSSITITQPLAISVVKDSVNGTGNCTSFAKILASGGTPPYTYLWNPGGGTTDSITKQCKGTYCCTITDNNGCPHTVCVDLIPTGVEDIYDNNNISVYPNPTNGKINVGGLTKGQTVELYNYLGQTISTLTVDNSIEQIDLAAQANGIYLIRVLNKDGSIVGQAKVAKSN